MKLWKRLTALCLSALVCVTLLTACGRKESADGRASLSVCVGETPATMILSTPSGSETRPS